MINNIIFDLGQVLCPFDRQIPFRRLSAQLMPERRAYLAENQGIVEERLAEPARLLETGAIELDDFRAHVEDVVGLKLHPVLFRRLWCDMFRVDMKLVAIGEALSARYGVWLASNTSRAHYEWILERFPRIRFYRDAALSYELGLMKPDAAYYETALEKFGIEGESAVFIDDLPENVEGAVAAGMKGIVYKGREALVSELERMGIEVG
jgi:putative hydrolase of the HAD superfamily